VFRWSGHCLLSCRELWFGVYVGQAENNGSLAKNANTSLRLSFRATTTLPSASTPWIWNTARPQHHLPNRHSSCNARPDHTYGSNPGAEGVQLPRRRRRIEGTVAAKTVAQQNGHSTLLNAG
jgi:hypothetical protein